MNKETTMKLSLKIVLLGSAAVFALAMTHVATRQNLVAPQASTGQDRYVPYTPEMTPVEARYQEWKKDPESETIESKYDRMPQECKDAGATPAECKEAGELLERVNEGPTWSGAEFDYNRSLVK